MIKFQKSLSQFTHIIGFDLALYKTGVCIYDLSTQSFCEYQKIEVSKDSKNAILDLYNKIYNFLDYVKDKYGDAILVTKESLPQQCGPHSTVATLQQLAKAHAVLSLCVAMHNIEEYDDTGVYAISVKAYFRTPELPKPQKSDIRKALVDLYNLDNSTLTDDISDSMGVVHVLVNKKWNTDIDAEIKALKKEIKTLKMDKAIDLRRQTISFLLSIKNN